MTAVTTKTTRVGADPGRGDVSLRITTWRWSRPARWHERMTRLSGWGCFRQQLWKTPRVSLKKEARRPKKVWLIWSIPCV